MTNQQVKRYNYVQRWLGHDHAVLEREYVEHGDSVDYADFSRTDAELRKERTARVEAERKVTELDKGRIEGNAQINRLWDRIASLESDLSAVTASIVEHAKTIDGLRAELARARRMTLTGLQLSHMADFIDGDHETELTLARYPEGKDEETGEIMPAGLYCFLTEYPDEGRLYLPEDAESARSATHSADTGGKG